MNGGRQWNSSDSGGCLSEIGYAFLAVMIIGGLIVTVVLPYQWVYNQPTKVCVAWGDFPVIKEERNGFNTEKILVNERVCTKWEEPKP